MRNGMNIFVEKVAKLPRARETKKTSHKVADYFIQG